MKVLSTLKNAIEALEGHESGCIVLRAGKDARGKVLIQVCDNGRGIEAGRLDNIFVPFFTTKPNGSGIGLSISRQIMFNNKGLISVKTVPGQGSEFTLRFR